ncbi:hypothetical protein ACFYR1_06000 [Streptomyces canus]|uniref:hypothetical protein n=1 Tax=Streptomyces canus TaxID=58343 RepID=UPI0036AF5C29
MLPAEQRQPARPVVDRPDAPYAVVPGSRLAGRIVPENAREDGLLAAGLDGRDPGKVPEGLFGRTIAECQWPVRAVPAARWTERLIGRL